MVIARARAQVRLRCYHGECVVYHDLTGDTHLLGGAHAACAQALYAEGALPRERLAALCVAHGADADEVLAHLARLRLCEDAPG